MGKWPLHEGRRLVGVMLLRPPWDRSPELRKFMRFGFDQLRKLDHPHIVRILDVIDEDDLFGTVVEPLTGDNLDRVLKYHTATYTEAEVVRIMRDLASALEHAHGRGVVFGNLKPSNVEVGPDGAPKIIAFPRPAFEFKSFLDAAAYLGFPYYHAPEFLRCEPLDERTDVYGLGITVYEMIGASLRRSLTGHLGADLNALATEEWPEPERVVEQIHPQLNKVVARCLRKDPAQRYPSAAEVLKDLRGAPGQPTCLIGSARLLEIVQAAFPAPLAALARDLERENHLLAQRDKLLNQINGLVGYLGFLAARSLAAPPTGTLERPALGRWVELVRQAWGAADAGWPFAEFRTQTGGREEIPGRLNDLVQRRNQIAHGAAPEGEVLHNWVQRATAEVRQAYRALLFLARYALVSVEDLDYRDGRFLVTVRRLEGAGPPEPPLRLSLPQPCSRGEVYFADAEFRRMLPLAPFVVQAPCPLCHQREVFFYVSTSGAERRYVTPDRGHTLSCPAAGA
jgi:hypothetical protein